jgi:hypothetical protein
MYNHEQIIYFLCTCFSVTRKNCTIYLHKGCHDSYNVLLFGFSVFLPRVCSGIIVSWIKFEKEKVRVHLARTIIARLCLNSYGFFPRGVIYCLNMLCCKHAYVLHRSLHAYICKFIKLLLFRNVLCTCKIMLREEDFKSHSDFVIFIDSN